MASGRWSEACSNNSLVTVKLKEGVAKVIVKKR